VKGPTTFVIAEAGVNHGGSIGTALGLVDAAAGAGADAVKFQTFRTDALTTRQAHMAAYQSRALGGGASQSDMLRKLELSEEAHVQIAARCREQGIGFMSTAFDPESLAFVAGFETPALKVGSGDLTNAPLLLQTAALGRPILLSTGMSTLAEVEAALGVLAAGLVGKGTPSLSEFEAAFASDEGQAALAERITLLHCVSDYPAPIEQTNLLAMRTLNQAFGLPVGYSDHTLGISVALAAVALGAVVLEKHFTLDRSLPGPDHAASLEPGELRSMVEGIREVEQSLGHGRKVPQPCEMETRDVARRSVVAAREIRAGERFSSDNLTVKRPAGGISPIHYWALLDRTAGQDYAPDDLIIEPVSGGTV
jgi:N-acetylneuraminate synthase